MTDRKISQLTQATSAARTDLLPLVQGGSTKSVDVQSLVAEYSTIAALKAAGTPGSVRKAHVLGYYSAGDGGGGEFYWDSASSATDNGGTVIAADAGGVGRWRRTGYVYLTPQMFGAAGDGVTDDRAALFNADAVTDEKVVPSGTFLINSALSLTTTWRFAGGTIKPANGIALTASASAIIYSSAAWYDTSAGGTFSATAGSTMRSSQAGAAGHTADIINGYAGNTIAAGSGSNVIAGGGNSGGNQNEIAGVSQYRTISGGYDNSITDAIASTIAGGAHHVINGTATHATIGGGTTNTIDAGDYGTIAGGNTNIVSASNATVGGGVNNSATASAATVAGGNDNDATGAQSTIGGGTTNDASASISTVAGGSTNVAAAAGSSIGGGQNNSVGSTGTATYATVAGGLDNDIGDTAASSEYSAVGGGRLNKVRADYAAIPGGRENQVTEDYGVAIGYGAKADKIGQFAQSGQYFSAAGDCQSSVLIARRQTTNATPTAIRLGSGTARITIPSDTTWAFDILVVARRTDADGESAAYRLEGCIDNNAGTTALVGTVTQTVIAEDTAAWDVTATADNTNDALEITATGEAAKTINWVARVTLVEVTG